MLFKFITVLSFLFAAVTVHAEDWHTFTNKKGASFIGRILEVKGNRVKIMRKSDSGIFSVGVSKLSKSDQTYIQNYEQGKTASTLRKESPQKSLSSRQKILLPKNVGKSLIGQTKSQVEAHIKAIEARPAPRWATEHQADALAHLNVYRYLCGANANVVLNKAESQRIGEGLAEWVALGSKPRTLEIAKKLKGFMHIPAGHLRNTVTSAMACGSPSLKTTLFTRWSLLKEGLQEVGIGTAHPRSAINVAKEGKTQYSGDISYPGAGYFPLKYLRGAGWSFHTEELVSRAETIEVEVYRLTEIPKTREELEVKTQRAERFLVSEVFRYANTVIFEPRYPRTGDYIKEAGIYAVVAKGKTFGKSYIVVLYE